MQARRPRREDETDRGQPAPLAAEQPSGACGIDFPRLHYRDLAGESPTPQVTFRGGVRWLDTAADLRAAWEYRRKGKPTAQQRLGSWRGVGAFTTFAPDDPRPRLRVGDRRPDRLLALRHRDQERDVGH